MRHLTIYPTFFWFILAFIVASIVTPSVGLTPQVAHAELAEAGDSVPVNHDDSQRTENQIKNILEENMDGTINDLPVTGEIDWSVLEELYSLSEADKEQLRQQGVLILNDHSYLSLTDAYAQQSGVAYNASTLVTSDALLHLFHNLFSDLLPRIEKGYEISNGDTMTVTTVTGLNHELNLLVNGLQERSEAEYTALNSTPISSSITLSATHHNLLFFSVARNLLDDDFKPHSSVANEVMTYKQYIQDHSEIQSYPGDDYTLYEPRGHYVGDETLERYFQASKWLGRRIFRIDSSSLPSEQQQLDIELTAAVLMAQWLQENPDILGHWQKIYDLTYLLVGPADSITPLMMNQAITNSFGSTFTIELLNNPQQLNRLRQELQVGDYPDSEIAPIQSETGQIPTRYVQFLGERYLPDAEVMQKTIHPAVTNRGLPSGLDVMNTLLKSSEAETLLAEEFTQYETLQSQLNSIESRFDQHPQGWWHRSVYNSWLYTLRPLLEIPPQDAPPFMKDQAWQRKSLNTALASWTQLRHDVVLYGKQSAAAFGGMEQGFGYVEPVPQFYRRLNNLTIQSQAALETHDLLHPVYAQRFEALSELLHKFENYADDELAGKALSAEAQSEIKNFSSWLAAFFFEEIIPEKAPMVVVDVATGIHNNEPGAVLHEGVGPFLPIIALYIEPGGDVRIGVGVTMSSYEFILPDNQRLTDAEWIEQLNAESPPEHPVWASGLMGQESSGGLGALPEESQQFYLPIVSVE